MKIRKTKENIKMMLDLAYDHAVMLQVLWYIYSCLSGRHDICIRENPFKDEELNTMFAFIYPLLPKKKD